MLTVGSLFAGIGGFDLGFERAGMRTLWQVEQSEFCRRVLERHFPTAQRFNDVREVTGCIRRWEEHGGTLLEYVDVLCGGFPCQDISSANPNAVGIAGERSGLWSEYARLVGELRPRYVVVENVSALLGRGLGRVLGDLAALGYDAEWDCIPASAVGAPHRRDRVWIVAYPDADHGRSRRPGRSHPGGERQREPKRALPGADADCGRLQERGESDSGTERPGLTAPLRRDPDRFREAVADTEGQPQRPGLCPGEPRGIGRGRSGDSSGAGRTVADAELEGLEGHGRGTLRTGSVTGGDQVLDAGRIGRGEGSGEFGGLGSAERGWWSVEPDVGRVAHGVPARVDRLRALGNALVPDIAEWIGRRIIDYEEGRVAA